MAYSVIRSWRQAIKDCSHGFVISVWFYISEGMVIAGQMPKCYSFSGSGCPFLLSAMSLGVRFENVFSTVWFVFFSLDLYFFLNPAYQHNKQRGHNRGSPSPFCLWVFPLSPTHTHSHTHPLQLSASSHPWFFTSCLSNIHLCLSRALIEHHEHMHNSVCEQWCLCLSCGTTLSWVECGHLEIHWWMKAITP